MTIRTVVAFDFDGTLIKGDSLLFFIQYARGKWAFYWTFFLHLPYLILMKCKLYPNDKAKERIFSALFAGMPYEEFCRLGRNFSSQIESMQYRNRVQLLREHLLKGASVYVISASIYEWVQPWCEQLGVKSVLATRVEVDTNNCLTGRFASPNCYGEEKVRRLLKVEPHREDYYLYAYGDSAGDSALLAFADEGKLYS